MNNYASSADTLSDAMQAARSQHGQTLLELSQHDPVLLVFLRHLGCTFCREAVADIARARTDQGTTTDSDAPASPTLDGARIAFVFMPGNGDTAQQRDRAQRFFNKYGIADAPRFPDPDKSLYHAFGLERGSLRQLFGVKSFTRGFVAGVLKGHGVGTLVGDGFQMPGVFLIDNGEVKAAYRHRSAADVPDYNAIATCTIAPA